MSSAELLAPQTPEDHVNPHLITGIPEHLRPENQTGQYQQGRSVFVDPTDNAPDSDLDGEWGYTRHAINAYGDTYQGRKLIGRDSRIDGGVYFGTYGGEAIVVDSEKYPDSYQRLFDQVVTKASSDGKVQRDKVLEAVFDTVKDNIKYSQQGVDQINAEMAVQNGDKIELSTYIDSGFGVCRHQALAAGLLLEKMKEAGHIRGQVSVDRSQKWNPIKGEREGHAWVRYTSHSGDVMILDVAQNYFGLLEDSEGDKHGWDYLRPEEQLAKATRSMGNTALGGI